MKVNMQSEKKEGRVAVGKVAVIAGVLLVAVVVLTRDHGMIHSNGQDPATKVALQWTGYEEAPISPTTIVHGDAVSACGTGWISHNGNCYKFAGCSALPSAITTCRAKGANVATLDSANPTGDYGFLKSLATSYTGCTRRGEVLLGYRRVGNTLSFERVSDNKDETAFLSGLWGPGQPNNARGEDSVGIYSDNTVHDFWSHEALAVVCQKAPLSAATKLSYLYLTTTQGDYNAVKDACKISGGVLASIHSAEENTRASNMCNGKKCFFGYNDIATEGTWVWEDGSAGGYTNWAPNEPNNQGNEDCAELRSDGTWNDMPCSSTGFYGICEKISTVTSYDCPPGTYERERNSQGCVCMLCPVGKLCLGGKDVPTACSLGMFQPVKGQSECDPAPPGTKVDTTGAVAPVKCSAGQWQNEAGQSSCKDAPAGSKVSGTGATAPEKCTPGTYQNEAGKAACKPCTVGNYCPENGLTGPVQCNFGTFQAGTGASTCELAQPGSIVDAKGKDAPTPCPSGTFQKYPGQMSCIPCPYKQVTSGTGNTECTPV